MAWPNRRPEVRVPEGVHGTVIGTDDGFRAVVDAGGGIVPSGRGFRVDWWIGADDRWHDPAVETAVRQVRPGAAPVLETRLRVPGGDIVATAWAALAGGSDGPAVVVELANETPVPVAVAVVVRPVGGVRRVAVDGRRLMADGAPAVVVDRDPGRFALAADAADLAPVVTGGRAVEDPPAPVVDRKRRAGGALVVPLTHGSGLRFAVPARDGAGAPTDLPGVERVTAGWAAHVDRAASVAGPDELADPVGPLLVDLLLAGPAPGAAATLAAWGLPHEAAARVDGIEDAAALWTRYRDPAPFTDHIDIGALVRGGGPPGAVASLAGLFAALGDDRAAADAASVAAPFGDGLPTSGPGLALADHQRRLVVEHEDGLALLPTVPAAWLGQNLEVHDLATTWGRLGYAVRWHGDRPALLWELVGHDDLPVTLTVPGLDPGFSTADRSGEVLLARPVDAAPVDPTPPAGSFS